MPQTHEKEKEHCLEDFSIGQKICTNPITMSKENIIAFANLYDPQDFHLDDERAKHTSVGTLIASGWHTACTAMRLVVTNFPKIKGGMLGRSVEKMEWPIAVYPGDTVKLTIEVIDLRPSNSKPDRGVMRTRNILRNQNDEVVLSMETVIILPRRV